MAVLHPERRQLENPYYFGFKAIINVLAQLQSKMGITEPIHFVFDEDTEKKRCLGSWDHLKLGSPLAVRNLMGDVPDYADDKLVLPLQAADLYAHWVRQWEIDGGADGIEKLKFPWNTERDIPRLAMKFREPDFMAEFAKAYDPNVLALARLKDPGAVLRNLEE